jgi:hypothetical protein
LSSANTPPPPDYYCSECWKKKIVRKPFAEVYWNEDNHDWRSVVCTKHYNELARMLMGRKIGFRYILFQEKLLKKPFVFR